MLFYLVSKVFPSCAVITDLTCLVQNNLGRLSLCDLVKVFVWLKPSTPCGSIALADVFKLPKEFVSLQNMQENFNWFPTNLRLTTLPLSESSLMQLGCSPTWGHLKREEGYCYFVFYPPHQAQRWSLLSLLCRLRDWENWKWWSLPAPMIKCKAKSTENDTQLPACWALGCSAVLSVEWKIRGCRQVCVTQIGIWMASQGRATKMEKRGRGQVQIEGK